MTDRKNKAYDDDEDEDLQANDGWLGGLLQIWPSAAAARVTLIGGAIVLALAGGALMAWQRFGPEIVSGGQYKLQPADLLVTPQPPWIHADVKAEVVRDGSLHDLEILDPQVTVRIAQAFATHSWVAEVRRVSKHHPAKVMVDLAYRRPVAMVEVDLAGQRGLLPVDQHGVLLPPDDFSPNEAREYLRVQAGPAPPAGPVGTSWGDPRVAAGAKIAAALLDKWRELGLYRLAVVGAATAPRLHGEPEFELATKQGTRLLWGHAPGAEAPGEATAAQKIARLSQFVSEAGPLDEVAPGHTLDLRDGQQLRPQARTARQPW